MSHGTDQGYTDAFQLAMERVRQGDPAGGESLLVDAVEAARRAEGPDSGAFARANHELGMFLAGLGHHERAIVAYRAAVDHDDPNEPQVTRDRLTYLLNLGDLLQRVGELSEAERVLRRGLVERERFYGRQHAGYGFGLEPLVKVLLRRGALDEALQAASALVANFWNNTHPRIAAALALRCEVLKAQGAEESAFDGLENLPTDIFVDTTRTTVARAHEAAHELAHRMLDDLLGAIDRRLGETSDAAIRVLSASSDIARKHDRSEAREAALRQVLDRCQRRGDDLDVVECLQGLALCQSEAGKHDLAIDAYHQALEVIERLDAPESHARVLCNLGLYLAELTRREEAEVHLRQGLARAREAGGDDGVGRCLVALGIFVQHGQQLDEARALLEEAVRRLAPSEPDAICARSHLDAIAQGGSCGCGDIDAAFSRTIEAIIADQLPDGLLESVRVDPAARSGAIQVSLARAASPDEHALLERVIRHAQAEVHSRMKRQYGD